MHAGNTEKRGELCPERRRSRRAFPTLSNLAAFATTESVEGLKYPITWQIYILQCANGSYCLGHTQHLQARIQAHQSGKDATHTAKYRPVECVYAEHAPDKVTAIRREKQLKKWSRAKKEALIKGDIPTLQQLAKSNQVRTKPSILGCHPFR